jgi:hypothetical protein
LAAWRKRNGIHNIQQLESNCGINERYGIDKKSQVKLQGKEVKLQEILNSVPDEDEYNSFTFRPVYPPGERFSVSIA